MTKRENELMWRVRRKATSSQPGEWVYLYVMLEFQSTVDRHMAVRNMTYMGLLYEDLLRNQGWPASMDLPPVVGVVVYTGRKPWRAKLDIADLIASVGPALAPCIPRVAYRLVDVWRCPELAERNLADATFRLQRSEQPGQAEAALGALIEAIRGPSRAALHRIFLAMVRELLAERLPGVDVSKLKSLRRVQTMFVEDKIDWSEKWVTQGREEGLEKGRAEGRAEARAETLAVTRKMLVNFVQARFGGSLADRVSALLAKISDLQTVLEIGEWLPACDNPEILLNRLESV